MYEGDINDKKVYGSPEYYEIAFSFRDISAEVDDHGTVSHLQESGVKRVIFPQEFLRIIEQTGDFQFVGW